MTPARCEEHGADPGNAPSSGPSRFALSPRQRQVLVLAGRGYTWRQTSVALGIAPGTVRGHLLRARERLGAANTTNAVVLAIASRQITIESVLSEEGRDG